jgi:hypothetical protein
MASSASKQEVKLIEDIAK